MALRPSLPVPKPTTNKGRRVLGLGTFPAEKVSHISRASSQPTNGASIPLAFFSSGKSAHSSQPSSQRWTAQSRESPRKTRNTHHRKKQKAKLAAGSSSLNHHPDPLRSTTCFAVAGALFTLRLKVNEERAEVSSKLLVRREDFIRSSPLSVPWSNICLQPKLSVHFVHCCSEEKAFSLSSFDSFSQSSWRKTTLSYLDRGPLDHARLHVRGNVHPRVFSCHGWLQRHPLLTFLAPGLGYIKHKYDDVCSQPHLRDVSNIGNNTILVELSSLSSSFSTWKLRNGKKKKKKERKGERTNERNETRVDRQQPGLLRLLLASLPCCEWLTEYNFQYNLLLTRWVSTGLACTHSFEPTQVHASLWNGVINIKSC